MNLVNDPWIPVVGLDGTARDVSLRTAFDAGDVIADLALNPCQRIATMRLLICIAQAALDGPADEAAWADCRDTLRAAALAYLDRWQHRFELFGEGAFLQVEGLAAGSNALADKLDLTAACGNNPTLLDQAAGPEGRVPSPAKLAMDLLVYQVYSPGGLIGQVAWDGRTTEKSCELAPALEGSLLHTVIRGATLASTIHANLLAKDAVDAWGRPTWELEHLRRAALAANATTYLGRLVPAARAIRCAAGSAAVTLANAVTCPKLPVGREPMGTVVLRKRGTEQVLGYVGVSLSRHPWRELGSLMTLAQTDRQGGALALARLRHAPEATVDIWTGGLAANKSKLLDMAEWSFSLPVGLLDAHCLAQYQAGVGCANDGEQAVRDTVADFAKSLKETASRADLARTYYWAALDRECGALAETAAEATARLEDAWLPRVREAALAAYGRACPRATPRQIQAYARGLEALRRRLASLAIANRRAGQDGVAGADDDMADEDDRNEGGAA